MQKTVSELLLEVQIKSEMIPVRFKCSYVDDAGIICGGNFSTVFNHFAHKVYLS